MYFYAFFCNLSILWTEFSALSWIRLAWMDENLSMNYNCEVELFVSYCDHFECGHNVLSLSQSSSVSGEDSQNALETLWSKSIVSTLREKWLYLMYKCIHHDG